MTASTGQLLRVQNFMCSTDGYGTGEGQSLDRPFGHADPAALAAWASSTANWPGRTEPGGTRGLDDLFTRDFTSRRNSRIASTTSESPAPAGSPITCSGVADRGGPEARGAEPD